MAGRLFPAIATPLPIERRTTVRTTPRYPRAPLWDFLLGDVVRDANGHVVLADGWKAWRQWVQATCLVQQNAYAVYRRAFGPDLDGALRATKRPVVEAELADTIRRALLADRRTKDVGSFAFTWPSGDTVYVAFVATPVIGPPATVATQFGV